MSFAHFSSSPGLNFNYSLFAVPAGWVVGMAPLWWAIGAANTTSPGAYRNANPKESWETLGDAGLSPKLKGRVLRAVAANNNTHVNLPLFASALAVANAAHVDSATLHTAAIGWVVSRIAYTLSYVLIEDDKLAYLRSGFYWGGMISCFTLFVKAANKYKSLPW